MSITVSENPSPRGDIWFNNPQNLRKVEESIKEAKKGELKTYSIDDIKSALGV